MQTQAATYIDQPTYTNLTSLQVSFPLSRGCEAKKAVRMEEIGFGLTEARLSDCGL